MAAHFLPFSSEKAAVGNRMLPAAARYANSDGQRRVSLNGTWKFLYFKMTHPVLPTYINPI